MTPRITPIPFGVERQSPMIDGAGTPFVAFQAERGDNANTKYCRIARLVAGKWVPVPCPDAEAIYDQPMWAFHANDGTAVVIGMDHDKKHWIVADVPDFKPLPSVAEFRLIQAQIAGLMLRLTALEAK